MSWILLFKALTQDDWVDKLIGVTEATKEEADCEGSEDHDGGEGEDVKPTLVSGKLPSCPGNDKDKAKTD